MAMCFTSFPFIIGLILVGLGSLTLVLSFNPRCEYPERRLVAPIVKAIVFGGIGILLLVANFVDTCPKGPIMLPCPKFLFLFAVLGYVSYRVLTFYASPHYWRRRLSSWADYNHFAVLDFARLYGGTSAKQTCFRVVLQDELGTDRKAEVTLGSNGGFNLNHVNLVWLD
jgi:hypothetical protein